MKRFWWLRRRYLKVNCDALDLTFPLCAFEGVLICQFFFGESKSAFDYGLTQDRKI
jgi:hypothetical protein